MRHARLHLIARVHGLVGAPRAELAHLADTVLQPLLDALEETAAKIALRIDGHVWEYLEAEREALVDRLTRLASAGGLELVGGGFFSPILALLPERDAIGQLEMAAGYLDRRSGVRPKGAWIDAGVWEPRLCEVLADAGAAWIALDEAMLRTAAVDGVPTGWYVTEHAGRPLAVLPIDRALGHALEEGDVEAVMATLRARTPRRSPSDPRQARLRRDPAPVAVTWSGPATALARAGEAAGLRRLLAALATAEAEALEGAAAAEGPPGATPTREGHAVFQLALPAETIAVTPSGGRVYIGSGVDAALMAQTVAPWRLDSWRQRRDALVRLGDSAESAEDWLRGGLWQAFLARYGEVDRMHKRMIEVSRRFAAVERVMRNGGFRAMSQLVRPRRALYRGQTGAAYGWGHDAGLHDADLRAAVHAALAEAEVAVEALVRDEAAFLEVSLCDLYAEFETAVLLRNRGLRAVLRPSHGGVLAALELVSAGAALHDTMTRRREFGHGPEVEADGHERAWLHDRFLAPACADAPAGAGWFDDSAELGDLLDARYRTLDVQSHGRGADERAQVTLACDGAIAGAGPDGEPVRVSLTKTLTMAADADRLEVRWRLDFEPAPARSLRFGAEINASLGAAHPAAGCLRWQGGHADATAPLRLDGLRAFDVEHARARLRLRFDRPVALECCPIETVAQPLARPARRCFQGVAMLWSVEVAAGSASAQLAMQLELARRGADGRNSASGAFEVPAAAED